MTTLSFVVVYSVCYPPYFTTPYLPLSWCFSLPSVPVEMGRKTKQTITKSTGLFCIFPSWRRRLMWPLILFWESGGNRHPPMHIAQLSHFLQCAHYAHKQSTNCFYSTLLCSYLKQFCIGSICEGPIRTWRLYFKGIKKISRFGGLAPAIHVWSAAWTFFLYGFNPNTHCWVCQWISLLQYSIVQF